MFGDNLKALAKHYQVIALDLQGHGRTADIDRPLSVELMADDVAALMRHLELGGPTCSATPWAVASRCRWAFVIRSS